MVYITNIEKYLKNYKNPPNKLFFIRENFVQEIPYHLERMEFGTELDGTQDFFQMFWPIMLSHKEHSYIYNE